MGATNFRRTGEIALVSGVLGILAVGLLVAALVAPTPAPGTMRRATSFFAWQNGFVVLQALSMIPVTLGLFRATSQTNPDGRLLAVSVGLLAQIALIPSAGLLITGTVSDMLYMAPIGLVGLWLLLINKRDGELFTPGIVWAGRIAGFGLLLIGVGFMIYGIFVAPAVFIRPLTDAELDAQSLTTANLIAHVCMAAGTLLGRLLYPIWIVVLGRRMIQLTSS